MKTVLTRMFSTICLLLFFYYNILGQTVSNNVIVREALDEMFELLDKSKVPTGYLLDYAVDIVDFDNYDGLHLTDSNYVTPSSFCDILTSIKSASVGTSAIGDVSQIMTDLHAGGDNINIGYVLYRYNYIKESALQDKLIDYTSGKVKDVYMDGVWQNPYNEAYLFAFTPGVSMSEIGNVIFSFSMGFSRFNIPSINMQFDAGDGNGYRNVNVLSEIPVNYTSTGLKELKLKVTLWGGIILESHSSLYITDVSRGHELQGMPLTYYKRDSLFTSNTYSGNEVGAGITTLYRNGSSRLTRPFVVVEGFDPWELLQAFGYIKHPNNVKPNRGATYIETFVDEWSLGDEYDLIYIDWYNSTANIIDNAYLLVEIINKINQEKVVDGCMERSVIMGQSMGGLIARLALLMMEEQNNPHGVSTYISHDSPHLGANVPLGALYFVQQVLCFLNGHEKVVNLIDLFRTKDINDAQRITWETIHSPAVKQMLVNHVNEDGILNNSVHSDWQSLLEYIGYPVGDDGYTLEKLAIVNGGTFDQSGIFEEMNGRHYLWLDGYAKSSVFSEVLAVLLGRLFGLSAIPYIVETPSLFIAMMYLGSNRFDIHGEVNPFMGYNQLLSSLKVTYTKKFLWLVPKVYEIFNSEKYAPSTGFLYDNFPGSWFNVMESGGVQNYTCSTYLYEVNADVGVTNKVMFIPTASALDVFEESIFNYSRNFYQSPPSPRIDCPFDAYALANDSQYHTHVDASIFDWLDDQIDMKIVGPDYVGSTASYSISGISNPVNWTTSNKTIAIIDNSGKLTITGDGVVTIIAEKYEDGKLYRKTKDVVVDFPDMIISTYYSAGNGYTFTAKSSDPDAASLLSGLVSDGLLSYEWSLIDSDGNMMTEVTSSDSFSFLPDEDELITISLRLVDTNGRKGARKSVSFNLRTPMSINYKYVVVDSQQNVYFIKDDNTYEIGMPSDDFIANFRLIPMNETDNTLSDQLRFRYLKGADCYISYPYGIRMTGYMQGVPFNGYLSWRFDFFERDMFLDELEETLLEAGGDESFMKDFYLTLCNTEQEPLQDIPFVIVYKPVFPEN